MSDKIRREKRGAIVGGTHPFPAEADGLLVFILGVRIEVRVFTGEGVVPQLHNSTCTG